MISSTLRNIKQIGTPIEDGPGDCTWEIWQASDGTILVRMYGDDAHCTWYMCQTLAAYETGMPLASKELTKLLESLRLEYLRPRCVKCGTVVDPEDYQDPMLCETCYKKEPS